MKLELTRAVVCCYPCRHVGDLGNVQVTDGEVQTTITDHLVTLYGSQSVIGKSMVVCIDAVAHKFIIKSYNRSMHALTSYRDARGVRAPVFGMEGTVGYHSFLSVREGRAVIFGLKWHQCVLLSLPSQHSTIKNMKISHRPVA